MSRVPRVDVVRTRVARAAIGLAAVVPLAMVGCSGPAASPPSDGDAVVPGATYHVDPAGDDGADGLTEATAWRTLDRASAQDLHPGDAVLLRGGAVFVGTLGLDARDGGDPGRPVVIGSFGEGKAQLHPVGRAAGVDAVDTSGLEVRDLVITGDADAYDRASGVSVFAHLPGDRVGGVVLRGLDVSGFRIGVAIGATERGAGLSGVTVEDVRVHDNRDAGLITYGPEFDPDDPWYAVADLEVSGVVAADNPGDPDDTTRNSGSGIVLGSVDGGHVVGSAAHGNGAACAAAEGPVGIWAYDATRVLIERNVSYGNRTARADGGGFDLDQNVSDSVLQHNLAHDNAGPGYLLYSTRDNDAQRGNVVRFNVSVDDAGGSDFYAGITVIGRVNDARVHHNTVVAAEGRAALRVSGGTSGVVSAANLLLARGAGDPVLVGSSAGVDVPAADAGPSGPGVVFRGDVRRTSIGDGTGSGLVGPLTVAASESWAAEAAAGLALTPDSPLRVAARVPGPLWEKGMTDLAGHPVDRAAAVPGALQ